MLSCVGEWPGLSAGPGEQEASCSRPVAEARPPSFLTEVTRILEGGGGCGRQVMESDTAGVMRRLISVMKDLTRRGAGGEALPSQEATVTPSTSWRCCGRRIACLQRETTNQSS